MTRTVAVTNQKGGVGKTTTCVNLCASLAATRRRVLLVDMDPQGNATMGCGIDKYGVAPTGYEVLMGQLDAAAATVVSEPMGFDILPANADLTAAEVELMQAPRREQRLRDALRPLAGRYDYIVIDCPPALNMLTVNALVAADGVVIPMQCEYYALEGLSALLSTIRRVQESANPELRIEGVLRTMFDPRNNLANEVAAQLADHFGDQLYRTIIPRNVRLAEAPSHGQPVLQYDRTSRGALAYLALAGEVLRRGDPAADTAATAPGWPADRTS